MYYKIKPYIMSIGSMGYSNFKKPRDSYIRDSYEIKAPYIGKKVSFEAKGSADYSKM